MRAAEDFDVFVAILDAGSISEAARELDVPRASLSRQLARLEERLGVRLVHRSTRKLVATPAGVALYPRARALVLAANAAVESVARLDDVPRGLLRVSTPPHYNSLFGGLFSTFLRKYPHVQVELQTSARHVDLVAEHVDVAIRGGVLRDTSLIARPISRSMLTAVAAPSYLDEHGVPANLKELAEHACLRGFAGGKRPNSRWPLRDGGEVEVDGPFVSDDMMALRGAAEDGLGIALIPGDLIKKPLADGSLVAVLPEEVGQSVPLSVVWKEREFLDPKIRAFVDVVVRWDHTGGLRQVF
ncbi:MAG: LysR family transcriptional regulator [Polyangiales bacterium]